MATSRSPWVSVVIPVKDERDNLTPLLEQLQTVLAAQDESKSAPFEVLVVDDGSVDGTGPLLDEFASRHGWLSVIHFDRNYGKSSALDAGFRHVRGDAVVIMDGDCQNDPADIPVLLQQLKTHDMVGGWRTGRQDNAVRKISSRIGNAVRRWVIHDQSHDSGCGFMAFRRSVVQAIPLFEGIHRFFPAMATIYGFTVAEVPVRHHPRVRGVAKYGVGNRLFRGLYDLIAVRWMHARRLRYRLRGSPRPPSGSL
jgi:glycosyltransferase involved in cell wall biosynthesis